MKYFQVWVLSCFLNKFIDKISFRLYDARCNTKQNIDGVNLGINFWMHDTRKANDPKNAIGRRSESYEAVSTR